MYSSFFSFEGYIGRPAELGPSSGRKRHFFSFPQVVGCFDTANRFLFAFIPSLSKVFFCGSLPSRAKVKDTFHLPFSSASFQFDLFSPPPCTAISSPSPPFSFFLEWTYTTLPLLPRRVDRPGPFLCAHFFDAFFEIRATPPDFFPSPVLERAWLFFLLDASFFFSKTEGKFPPPSSQESSFLPHA